MIYCTKIRSVSKSELCVHTFNTNYFNFYFSSFILYSKNTFSGILIFYFTSFFSHIDSTSEASKLKSGGYICPQCRSKYCELPTECRVCGLTLVSAPHLARSYHHLFPVQAFTQLDADKAQDAKCFACRKKLNNSDKYVSSTKSSIFLFV